MRCDATRACRNDRIKEVGITGTGISSRVTRYVAAVTAAAALTSMTPAAEAHRAKHFRSRRAHVEKRAHRQIGAPYSHGGSSPRGFDCSGLTRWVYLGHGASLPHSSQAQFALGERKRHRRVWRRSNLKIGDLVFHKTTSARVGHAGIYVGGGRFISATTSSGVRVRSLFDSYWGPRWVAATRLQVTMHRKH